MTAAMSNLQASPSTLPVDPSPELEELVIAPRKGWIAVDWAEMWRCRELLLFLVWRDVKVRYKQTVLGVVWAVIQPLLATLIFTLFGKAGGFAAKLDDPSQFAAFIFIGLVPWQFFQNAVNTGSLSLLNQQHLITKVYFPRLFIPTGNVGGAIIDMGISTGLMFLMCLIFGVMLSWQIIFLPLLMVIVLICALGTTYLLSALTMSYRDFRFLVPFMLQMWMWVSATFYRPEWMFGKWEWLSYFNPMVGIVCAFRSVVMGEPWHFQALGISIVGSFGVLLLGMFYFRKTERRFADIA